MERKRLVLYTSQTTPRSRGFGKNLRDESSRKIVGTRHYDASTITMNHSLRAHCCGKQYNKRTEFSKRLHNLRGRVCVCVCVRRAPVQWCIIIYTMVSEHCYHKPIHRVFRPHICL